MFVKLGPDYKIYTHITGIAAIVKRTGKEQLRQDLLTSGLLQNTVDKAAKLFRGRKLLFLVDDLWWVNGFDDRILDTIRTLLCNACFMAYGGSHTS